VRLTYRWLEDAELERLSGLDRSERITTAYVMSDEGMQARAVSWDVPNWHREHDGHDSLAEITTFCRRHMAAGARALGCLTADDRLAGIGVMRIDVEPGVAQLAFLHVSRTYRRQGIAQQLLKQLIAWARELGAREIYVSSAPSESAVSFYRSLGFGVTDRPIAELLALEPDDIHMRLPLERGSGGCGP
jgi:ribosomal protein S18 acetylase RimI-like enzyme